MKCAKEGCKKDAQAWNDRFGIFSGYACDEHKNTLPGQGDMWDYEPQEDLEPEVDFEEEPWTT